MKKLLLIIVGCFLVYAANAQDKEDIRKNALGNFKQADRVVVNVFSDIWMNAPTDSMKIKKINRGADVYLMKEFRFGKSNFGFAIGIGIGSNNLYSNANPIKNYTLDSLTGKKNYDGVTVFKKLPTKSSDSLQDINYKNNKFTTVFLDIPIEFRYRLKNNAFKVYLGGKFGFLLSDHTKYNGDDYSQLSPTGSIRTKQYKIANVESIRYGLTARIGWKWIQVYGYYSLSKLFKKDKGPDMYPISVGLTISPY